MPFSFGAPELLLLAIPVFGVTILLSLAARHHLSRGRRRLALIVRSAILGCLVLALANFQLALPVDRLTTIFVVDLSDSVGTAGHESALAFVREAIEEAPDGDRAGIVAFGADALVDRLPSELRELDTIASVPTRAATDIGAALRLASALFPEETQKRIVLVSDGNDTTGRGQTEAALAAARGVQIQTSAVGLGDAEEVLVERLTSPNTARVGERIDVEATIRSTVAQRATVRLFADGRAIASQQVDLVAGPNRVVFDVDPGDAGFHTFRVLVEAPQDTFSQNDRADTDTIVKGEPKTLVVAGDEAVAAQLVASLRAERHDVDVVEPEAVADDLAGIGIYDSIVLVDVAAARLGEDRMEALRIHARDLGRGLVMVGGEQSYGAGGYRDTPLEDALPVEMDVRDRQRQPDVALVVVIDKSGSMDACHCNTADRDLGTAIQGVPKVDIGKEAILRAVATLTARDEFGVVAFDQDAHWIVRTAPLGQVGDVEAQIAGISPTGQTNIFAGLSEAVASLEDAQATRRHVILLTDGWSSSGDYDALLERMTAAGITLSTVGAGAGSATVLEDLAERGGGRFYDATNPASIPDIFLKETQQVSGQQIVEEEFFPVQTSSSPILRGLEEGLPRLLGYNGTTAKAAAQTVLVSSRDDPVLAQWQYGLGRTVAWTSDTTGRWARNWIGWQGFDRFVSQLVAWTFPGEESSGVEASFVTDGDETILRVQSAEVDGSPRDFYDTIVRLVTPTLGSQEVRLVQVAPGIYEVPLGRLESGAYMLRVSQTRPGSSAVGRTLGLVAPTPAEYRLLGTNEALLAALRAATGGAAVVSAEEVWRHDLASTRLFTDLWPWLLLIALLLWPLDVGIRRVSLSRADVAAGRAWAWERWAGRGRAAARPDAVGAMLSAKRRAGGNEARTALTSSPATAPSVQAPRPEPAKTLPPAAPAPAPAPSPTPGPSPREATPAPAADTLARLREAKERARR